MNDKMLKDIINIIEKYTKNIITKSYTVNSDLLAGILDRLHEKGLEPVRIPGIAVMYYFISEAFRFHCDVSSDDKENPEKVIYGDVFGVLYHRTVIDFEEYGQNETIISEYKKKYIDAFEINKGI